MLARDLRSSAFRGAAFLVPSDQLEAGRNAITHSFPDASFRYIEDNGRIPPKFTITAIISEPGLTGKLKRLLSALDRPGPGTLRHPWYGNRTVMVDGTYTVHRDDRNSGYVELEIPFAVTGKASLPALLTGVAAVVTGLALESMVSALSGISLTPPRSSASFDAVSQSIKEFGAVLDAEFGGSSASGARLSEQAPRFLSDAEKIAELVGDALRAPFDDVSVRDADLVSGLAAAVDVALAIKDTAEGINPTTIDLVERAENLRSLSLGLGIASFVCYADAVASRAYTTADEVAEDESALIAFYERIVSFTTNVAQSSAIANIVTEASEVLRAAEVRLPRLTTMPVHGVPVSVLAYSLYESDDNVQQIVDLNQSQSPPLLAGTVTVLEEVA